jgi:predicted GIY-YIG superfamily endonuclease
MSSLDMKLPFRNIRKSKPAKPFTATIYYIYTTNPEVQAKYPGRILYIGSTWTPLKVRFSKHLTYTRNKFEKGSGIHKFMAQEGLENFDIAPLEILENCYSREQMMEMEEELRQVFKPVFNMSTSSASVLSQDPFELPFVQTILSYLGVKCTCHTQPCT